MNGERQTSEPRTSVVGASSVSEERRRPSNPGRRKHEPQHPPKPGTASGSRTYRFTAGVEQEVGDALGQGPGDRPLPVG